MADIFLSYSRADRDRVAQLAQALAERGWDVFWDTVVLPGQQWRDVIHQQLEEATCVVAVWSEASSRSRWVVEEASEALDDGKLLPVMIDEVDPPFGFRGVEAADLTGWRPGETHPGFDVLVDALTARIATPPADVGDVGGEGLPEVALEAREEPEGADMGAVGGAPVPPVVGVAGTSVVADVTGLDVPGDDSITTAESVPDPEGLDAAVNESAALMEAAGPEKNAGLQETAGPEASTRVEETADPAETARPEEPAPEAATPAGRLGTPPEPPAPSDTDVDQHPVAMDARPDPSSPSTPVSPATDSREPAHAGSASTPSTAATAPPEPTGGQSASASATAPARPTAPPSAPPRSTGPGRGVWFIFGGVLVVAAVVVFLVFSGDGDGAGGGEQPLVPTEAGAGADGGEPAQEVFAPDVVDADQIVAEAAPGVMTIDGATGDWVGVERAYRLRHFVRDTGAIDQRLGDDSPAVVAVAHDDTALYVFVSADDDIYSQPNEGNQIWRGDAFDINISTVPVTATPGRPDGRTFQLTITPLSEITGRPGAVLFVGNGEQFFDNTTSLPLTVDGAVDGSGRWTLEAQIPWAVFGLDGPPGDSPYAALFSVFDNDGEVTSSGRSQQTVILGHLPDAAFQSDVTTWGSFDVER